MIQAQTAVARLEAILIDVYCTPKVQCLMIANSILVALLMP